jgi:hypothetical protein
MIQANSAVEDCALVDRCHFAISHDNAAADDHVIDV